MKKTMPLILLTGALVTGLILGLGPCSSEPDSTSQALRLVEEAHDGLRIQLALTTPSVLGRIVVLVGVLAVPLAVAVVIVVLAHRSHISTEETFRHLDRLGLSDRLLEHEKTRRPELPDHSGTHELPESISEQPSEGDREPPEPPKG